MTQTITLSGDYQYDSWKIDNLTNAVINAYKAEWTLANIGSNTNPYPVSVRDSGTVTIAGGTIVGEVSLTLDWKDAYVNSAAVMARDVANVTIQDWTISRAWDGIRLSGNSDDTFTIDNVWLTNIRDDGIENDYGQSGTVKDSLFDGVFVGISLASTETGNQTDHVVTLDNVLIRMKSFLYQGEVTHQSIFKTEVDKSPGLNIHDCVFAIEDVNHHGTSRLEIAWDSVDFGVEQLLSKSLGHSTAQGLSDAACRFYGPARGRSAGLLGKRARGLDRRAQRHHRNKLG